MLKDQLKLHFVVFLWSFTAILGMLIKLPAAEMVFFRILFSVIALIGILFFTHKNIFISKKIIFLLLANGVVIGAHWILFFASARVSKISIGLAGLATATLFAAILEPLMLGRPIRLYEIMLGFSVLVGLSLVLTFEYDHFLGLLFGVLAAFTSAFFSVWNSKFAKAHDPLVITFYEMIGALLATAAVLPLTAHYFSEGKINLMPSASDLLYISILALVCTVYAFYSCVELMRRLSAFYVNLTVNLEPVYGIILAVLVFGSSEQMTLGFYAGTSLIILSVLSYPFLQKRFGAGQ